MSEIGANKKVKLLSTVLFTICSILVLDTFVAPAIIGVSAITLWLITAIIFFIPSFCRLAAAKFI